MQDFSVEKPKLHKLYVGYAYEVLQIAQEACRQLESLSQVHASVMAGALREKITEFCTEDRAYFDAAAMLFAGIKLEQEPETDQAQAIAKEG